MSTKSSTGKSKDEELADSKEAAMEAYNKLLEAGNHFQLAAKAAGLDLKHDSSDQLFKGRVKVKELSSQATDFMREKPGTTLGLALATGFVIAHLLFRKR